MFGLIIAAVCAYLVGSIPSGLILGKSIWGIDLREHGSHNIGATNAWRTIGKAGGILIFLCDLIKGGLGVWFAIKFADGSSFAQVLGGIMAIVGHSWSLFLGFKGGKGVATGLGVVAMLMPTVTLVLFGVWFAIVYFTGYVSLGSIVGAALAPVMAWLFGYDFWFIAFGCLAAVFIIVRHKQNIGRLLDGTESKIKAAK
ncbi:MAG: glycerol-3-phosphate 1-O-acyltransferase PlsY [Schwartzia sp.]|nr:glycerol-3-phosphate 1-O-acyltransferase PlsY [Schwartzia sp. (in: firmicutes)]